MVDVDKIKEDSAQVFVTELMNNFNISKTKAVEVMEAHDVFITTLAELQNAQASVLFLISTAVGIAIHEKMDPELFMAMVHTVLVACTEDVGVPTAQA